MPFLEWSEEQRTGLPALDSENRTLIDDLGSFYEAVLLSAPQARLRQDLSSIAQRIEANFEQEEEFMQASDYPRFGLHRAEHDRLRETLKTMQDHIERKNLAPLSDDLLTFIKGWAGGHIPYCDRALASYLRERGVKGICCCEHGDICHCN